MAKYDYKGNAAIDRRNELLSFGHLRLRFKPESTILIEVYQFINYYYLYTEKHTINGNDITAIDSFYQITKIEKEEYERMISWYKPQEVKYGNF